MQAKFCSVIDMLQSSDLMVSQYQGKIIDIPVPIRDIPGYGPMLPSYCAQHAHPPDGNPAFTRQAWFTYQLLDGLVHASANKYQPTYIAMHELVGHKAQPMARYLCLGDQEMSKND